MSAEALKSPLNRMEEFVRLLPKSLDRGAILAAALLAAAHAPSEKQGALAPAGPEFFQPLEWNQFDALTSKKFDGFVTSLVLDARKNSNPKGLESAFIYVITPTAEEQVANVAATRTGAMVTMDSEAIGDAIESGGVVLSCHTHPTDSPVAGIESQRYVNPPSYADVENLITTILNNSVNTFENFKQMSRSFETCVATTGAGYWMLRVSDPAAAWSWSQSESSHRWGDIVMSRTADALGRMYDSGFFETYDTDRTYRKILGALKEDERYSFDIEQFVVLLERDLNQKKFSGKAREEVVKLIELFTQAREDESFEVPSQEFVRLNRVMGNSKERPGLRVTADEFELMREEFARIYGVELKWVDLPE